MKQTLGFLIVTSLTSALIIFQGDKVQTIQPEQAPIQHQPTLHILTTEELVKKTPLYYDCNRVEWYFDQIEKANSEQD